MIEPGQVADHRLVVAVVALADLHGGHLGQAHLQVAPEGVLVQGVAAGLHVALRTGVKGSTGEPGTTDLPTPIRGVVMDASRRA